MNMATLLTEIQLPICTPNDNIGRTIMAAVTDDPCIRLGDSGNKS
jgi:hypothetical protein